MAAGVGHTDRSERLSKKPMLHCRDEFTPTELYAVDLQDTALLFCQC
jgi:hypothetical protein